MKLILSFENPVASSFKFLLKIPVRPETFSYGFPTGFFGWMDHVAPLVTDFLYFADASFSGYSINQYGISRSLSWCESKPWRTKVTYRFEIT